ncbi:MBL fold metallo-hydrolase [Kaistia algarum]|uniref:MBL fold metallo-hydrolase n=1 Tax=Kaistia algarum TaxID=2083279 RepID=UPI000CE9286A|nr:MBL fold metallo-hydrolase [Kaistia algarum]MCX5515032.1 MBL fold metallo-hydrolase [Kaistia algarum]PPE79773.1 MBL fold metallo-hydrolase [Kaistia algarum]
MSLRLSFLGAAGTVTGSCYLIEAGNSRVLVDCGMFQGSKTLKALNYNAFPFDVRTLDAVLLTHAHIDHSGLLPKLFKAGYGGPILATEPTIDLLGCMLPDSGHIQEADVEHLNRRSQQRRQPLVEPIYTAADAEASLRLLRPVEMKIWVPVAKGLRARYWNAGHMLGSTSIEVEYRGEDSGADPVRLLFSGDIGPDQKLLQPGPEGASGLDYVICESTYGDRERGPVTDDGRRAKLLEKVLSARRRGGPLLIPSFAVERTQELITDLAILVRTGQLPDVPTFIDSPLARKVTGVFERHAAMMDHAEDLLAGLHSPWLRFAESVNDSKAIGRLRGFHIIIAASGMCDAGRIRHHLKQWLWHSSATVLLVGYQAEGTLGRLLQDGVSAVRIQGEEVRVQAAIEALDDYSGHADSAELLRWIAARGPIRRGLFFVHGEAPALEALRARAAAAHLTNDAAIVPSLDDVFELQGDAPVRVSTAATPRIAVKAEMGRDWHNERAELFIDIEAKLGQAADERARAALIRRLRRALDEG